MNGQSKLAEPSTDPAYVILPFLLASLAPEEKSREHELRICKCPQGVWETGAEQGANCGWEK